MKLLRWLPLASILLSIGVVVYAVWLVAFDNNPPITFYNDPGAPDRAVYTVGDSVRIHREVCQPDNHIDGVLHWVVVGTKHVYPLPDSPRPATPGCKQVDVLAFVVPPTLEPDTYYIDARIEFDVNLLAKRVVGWRSQTFEIIAPLERK